MRLFILGSGLFLLALFVGLGIPFMKRRIGPNTTAGIRTSETLNDPELWYDANEYGGRLMLLAGLAIGFLALALYFIQSIGDEIYSLTVSAAIILIVSLMTWKMLTYTRALARAKQTETETTKIDKDWHASLRVMGLVAAILVSLLLTVSAIPLAMGQVAPNSTYGFRVPETLSDPAVWYKANSYAGRLQILGSGLTIVLALGLYFVRRMSHVVYLAISLLAIGLMPIASHCSLLPIYILYPAVSMVNTLFRDRVILRNAKDLLFRNWILRLRLRMTSIHHGNIRLCR